MKYIKTFLLSLNPFNYHKLDINIKKALSFFALTLLIGILLIPILNIPNLIKLPANIYGEMAKIEHSSISSNISISEPIRFPSENPYFTLDTTGTVKKMTTEKLMITEEYIHYKPFNHETKIKFNNLMLPENKAFISQLITLAIITVLPAIGIIIYIILFIKYILISIIISTLLYIILDLFHKHIDPKKIFIHSLYASTFIISLEIIFGIAAPNTIIPLFKFIVPVYLITTIFYIVIVILSLLKKEIKNETKSNDEH